MPTNVYYLQKCSAVVCVLIEYQQLFNYSGQRLLKIVGKANVVAYNAASGVIKSLSKLKHAQSSAAI